MSRPDLNQLVPVLFDFAQRMLKEHGEFFPFGATLSSEGEVGFVAAHLGAEHSPSQDVIEFLVGSFRSAAAAGNIRAAGLCLDVRTMAPGETEKTDAICARLEHCDGEAVEVFLPYRKGMFGRLKYGAVFATPGDPVVFQKAPGS